MPCVFDGRDALRRNLRPAWSQPDGQHREGARLRESFRDRILRYVCNAAPDGETSSARSLLDVALSASAIGLAGDAARRARCFRRGEATSKRGREFSPNQRPAHEIRNACPSEGVDANVERRSRKQDWLPRADGVKRVRQIKRVPNRGHADQHGVETHRFSAEGGDGVGRMVETDRLISERREDLLVAEQTVAVVVNDEHGLALTEPRRRGRLFSCGR